MKVLAVFDSFKGSMTSLEAGNAAAKGILRADPDAQVTVRLLADGGEGTVDALTSNMGGRKRVISVTGPLGDPVDCTYGILDETGTAVIEMAGAAGLVLVPESKRNPLYTTTYGVGEVIRDAIGQGCRKFIVGIGGSATNDGGVGMLQALGFGFLDRKGHQIPYGAAGLKELERITDEFVIPELEQCSFRVACDVKNVLCGENGCSAVFGPQKGATPAMIQEMDQWLKRYADMASAKYAKANPLGEGTGAAGGLGFAFLSFMNAKLESGIQIVLEEAHLEDSIQEADLVLTGEGRLDGQTAMGKAPIGVAELAGKYGKTVVVLAGSVTKDAGACNEKGIAAFFPIVRGAVSLEEAMDRENAQNNMECAAEQVYRLYTAGRR